MAKERSHKKKLIDDIVSTYDSDTGANFIDVKNLPVREKIVGLLEVMMELLFPGYTGRKVVTRRNIRCVVGEIVDFVRHRLSEQTELALRHECRLKNCPTSDCRIMARKVVDDLLAGLPATRQMLRADVQAAFDGDPAAKSIDEVVISYPFITAIAVHRIAHELYLAQVPLIPRIMNEYAHSKTGIDIHPGARIGKNFFIDHGTGVVIGETSVIGNNVKIYQGVTLGAMSFPRDERGRIIKGIKRHPTIEDDVTIYAEATILGDVTIGKGAVIGGNVWVKKSVPPGVIVAMADAEPRYVGRQGQ